VGRGVLIVGTAALLGACGFGVDLGSLFDGPGTSDEGGGGEGGSIEGAAGDGSMGPIDATIPKVQVTAMSAGGDFACAVRIDGTIMCWGFQGSGGRLGDGTPTSQSAPVLVKDINDAKAVAVGDEHACAVRGTGNVWCWGHNDSRQLGDGTQKNAVTPVQVVALTDATQLALGGGFSCALQKSGAVSCWGDDGLGQLGDNMMTQRSAPAPVPGVTAAKQIAAANESACALVQTGDVYCWGHNEYGETGSANPPDKVLTATKVAGLSNITSISSGGDAHHFCATTMTGGVKCWGRGTEGQLGNSDNNNSTMPVDVVGISDAVGVATGTYYTCSWQKSGAVTCWGDNDWRQLGVGDNMPPDNATAPVPVAGVSGVMSVAAGGSHVCALMGMGQNISCWGSNFAGSLGRATRIVADTPVKALTPGTNVAVDVGDQHGCAVDMGGTISCWGMNDLRELGTTAIKGSGTPLQVPMLMGVTGTAVGQDHACALMGTKVKCWGHAQYGPLGDGNNPYIQSNPVVFGASPISAIGAGGSFTCGILPGGQVTCSGSNAFDRLGHPGGDQASPGLVMTDPALFDASVPSVDAGEGGVIEAGPPPSPPPFGGATKLAIGDDHSCAVYSGGKVACWGHSSNGECGSDNDYAVTYPNDIALPAAALDVASGGAHSCAVLNDGTIRCWGNNDNGQLGGAGGNDSSLRTPTIPGKSAKYIAAGSAHTCAVMTDGTVYCWGQGDYGEIGNGVRADTPTPQPVTGMTDAVAIVARTQSTCVLQKSGAVSCWGNDESAQLGDGTVLSTGTPAPVAGY
jgi:alpha-tubulin suppressor-like RCC1 family protein